MSALYRLLDDGYATIKKICYGRNVVGHVYKTDTGYRAVIGKIEVRSPTEAGAFQEVVAAHTGQHISEIRRNSDDFLRMKKVQAHTEIILDFLKDNSAANGGKLSFTNNDIAIALGKKRPDRALGNLISRLDFACYVAGLPPLGCAADATFKDAWQGQGIIDWDFPLETMCRRAKSHRWSNSDFERILYETQRLTSGLAHVAWKEEFAKHEAKIKKWCFDPGP
jgi:hypothetical protein